MNITVSSIIEKMPDCDKVVVSLSGGMDSTTVTRFAVEKYGASNVYAISFAYGQKQCIELEKARSTAEHLNLAEHKVVDITFFGDMVRGVCSNISGGSKTPTVYEVLGDPAPSTYVPNRNMVLLSIAASYAVTVGAHAVFIGAQSQDEYSYFDTTPEFFRAMNSVVGQMRKDVVQYYAPFQQLNKADEIRLLSELDGNVGLLKHTMSCYDPTDGVSCGICPSCAERIMAFMRCGLVDPIPYKCAISWKDSV